VQKSNLACLLTSFSSTFWLSFPKCWTVEGLVSLIDAGMNVARFNFSHGDHVAHGACLDRLRQACAQRPDVHVGVMLDTKGPEIRTGVVDPSCGGKLKLVKGELLEVGTDYNRTCTPQYLACSYKSLPNSVRPGSKILVADGALSLEVVECKESSVIAKILNNAAFGDKKNMNLPGAVVDLPTLTEKDIDDLQNFGVKHGVDFIAASFVRKASDIDFIRQVLGDKGKNIKIIAKIENQEGLENYDEILAKTDGIMVARGDLGMEIPIEKVFLAQKMMIAKGNIAGKPVVTATQMLESMISAPRPTRAECADVANAVLDGTDCVMLSGETANGEYPRDAVMMMSNTCLEAESIVDYVSQSDRIRLSTLEAFGPMSPPESVASSAVKTAWDTKAKFIVVLTETGNTARLIAKFRPSMPILALTSNADTARQMQGYMKNCRAVLLPSMAGTEAILKAAIEKGKALGWCSAGDQVVCVHGTDEGHSGSTNLLRVVSV
jgi:pyruvate kinase